VSARDVESAYLNGRNAALTHQLEHLVRELGWCTGLLTRKQRRLLALARDVAERRRLVAKVRAICARFGDTDWSDDDDLVRVLEKHLERHLEAARS
jgi:hypothetical protein